MKGLFFFTVTLLVFISTTYSQEDFDFAGLQLKFGTDKDYIEDYLTEQGYEVDEFYDHDTLSASVVNLEGEPFGLLGFIRDELYAADKSLGRYQDDEALDVFYKVFTFLKKYDSSQITITVEEDKRLHSRSNKSIIFHLPDKSIFGIGLWEDEKIRMGELPLLHINHSIHKK